MKKLLIILLFTISLFHTSLFTQWVQQTVPVTMPITGIKFIDTSKGWAVTGELVNPLPTDTSSIINTINGGTNWIERLRAPATEFTDLEVVDANNINVSAYDLNINRMIIYKTINGGLNWSSITMVPNMLINDMQYLNKDSAWECGTSAGPDVRTTTDGGNTWIVRTSGIAATTQKIFFLNYNTGFCGASFSVYKTTNAGLNWNLLITYPQSVHSVFFINETIGWAGLSNGRISLTTNGGSNWFTQQPFPINGNNTTDLLFIDNNTGWAGTGWFQKILKTTNGGVNWGYQLVTTGSVKISIVDNMHGWAADIGISNTSNGGGPITYVGINNISYEIPNSYQLYQNYPNPFNPVTNIKYQLTKTTFVNISVYDILGRNIETLVDENQKPGTYLVNWNAQQYTSGVYFYKLITKDYTETRKMLLIK